ILFAVLAAPLSAQRAMTSVDVAKLESVGSVAISPDGSMIAYTLSVPRIPFEEESGPAWSELHVIGKDGKSRPFITGEETIRSIKWSRDGQSITFLAKRDGDDHRALYQISVLGGEAVKIVEHETKIDEYSLGPDGRRIAFIAPDEQPEEIEELEEKGFNPVIYEEEDLFDRLWIYDTTEEKPVPVEIEGHVSEIHWSPVGDRLVFAVAPTPFIDDHYMLRRIRSLDVSSGEITGMIENPGKLGDIRVSPDGKWVAAITGADVHDPREGRLTVAPVTGGELRNLLPALEGHVQKIEWIDDDTIGYILDQGVLTHLEQVDVDGTDRKRLIDGKDHVFTGLSVPDKGDRIALVGESPTHPDEVFVARRKGDVRRLTNSNPWLSEISFAQQDVIRFVARDGLEIEGILIHPLGEEEGTRYPLIMAVHGGPESHHRNGWLTSYSYPGQVGAGKGYAIFYTNYRGSTGRGVDFSKLSQADPAGKEFDDLVDAIDYLIETGLVNRDKVGITGGSYGGYASAWGATYYSERYAAAVMNVGISDKISKIGTSDIPNELFLVHERVWPWEEWDRLRERSPLFHVEKARTPILILHGEDDTRVHPSQSLMLYRYLKILDNTPVRLVFYPGEGHGNKKSAARLDYNLRMLRWFDHYLKGTGGEPPPKDVEYPKEALEALR
ncbi:MAG: S9 family peptidase, partial [Thermoanaerobaculia bacterium]|nr:S9 family peptidase [Thermoanaerobaculia bacterium]